MYLGINITAYRFRINVHIALHDQRVKFREIARKSTAKRGFLYRSAFPFALFPTLPTRNSLAPDNMDLIVSI